MKIVSDPQSNAENDPSDQALDQLLSQARWPEQTEEMLTRMQSRWRTTARRHRMKPAIWCVAVAAAAVVAVFFASQILLLRERLLQPQIVEVGAGTDVKYLTITPNEPVDESAISRPANLLERMALLQRPVRQELKSASSTNTQVELTSDAEFRPTEDSFDVSKLLKEVADPDTQSAALSKFKEMSDPPVHPLLDRLTSPSLDERFAAATALAALNNPAVVELLVQRAQQNPGQREALIALGLSGNPRAEQAVSAMDLSSATRAQLLADTSQLRRQRQSVIPRS